MKKALIFGITGQDGSYLSELLLENNYEVHGFIRRSATPNDTNIKHIKDKLILHYGDMSDELSIGNAILKSQPDEIYNLAAMSQVRVSYDHPLYTFNINVLGFLRILEAVIKLKIKSKIYQACSSEMFGKVLETPQTEKTPFYPRSPYGISKAAAYYMARTYREGYNIPIYTGWLFNHESPRRGLEFVTRKICNGIAQIKRGEIDKIKLGNLSAKRDFGYAKDYVYWIWKIMQHEIPDDFIIATGENHSIQEFLELAFKKAGIDNWEDYVEFDKNLLRPAEVDVLLGNPEKAKRLLGYKRLTSFDELVEIMIKSELNDTRRQPENINRI